MGRKPRQTLQTIASCMHCVYTNEIVVRGHHIYQKSWRSLTGEVVAVEREEINQHGD